MHLCDLVPTLVSREVSKPCYLEMVCNSSLRYHGIVISTNPQGLHTLGRAPHHIMPTHMRLTLINRIMLAVDIAEVVTNEITAVGPLKLWLIIPLIVVLYRWVI